MCIPPKEKPGCLDISIRARYKFLTEEKYLVHKRKQCAKEN